MNASEMKVPRGVTQRFHPALGLLNVPAPKPEPPKTKADQFHLVYGMANPNRNVWGTDIEQIDADEFCVDCEHLIPGHFDNCDHAGRGK